MPGSLSLMDWRIAKKFLFLSPLVPYIKIIFYFFYSLFLGYIIGCLMWVIRIYVFPYYKYLSSPEQFYYSMLAIELETFLTSYLCGIITIIIFSHLSAIFVGILFFLTALVSPIYGVEGVIEFYKLIFTTPSQLFWFIVTGIISGIGAGIGTKGGMWLRYKFFIYSKKKGR